jgi:glycosyltransferase involved in cell wall biosynthesis
LDRSRYEPVVATIKPGPVVDLYRAEGVETTVEAGISDFSHTTLEWYGGRDLWRLPGKLLRIWPSIRRTRALVRRVAPDLVHLNSSTLAPAAIGCALEGVPVVWHIREPLAAGYLGLRRAWIRRAIDRCAARVIAICQNDADQLIPGDRIRVIYNFVDFGEFDRSLTGASIRAELGIPPDAPVVVMLGGVAEPKGTLILIRALPRLLESLPDARVIVAGPPPHPPGGPRLKRLAKRLLGADAYQRACQHALEQLRPDERAALIFTGVRRDIPQILAAADCLVFPSVVPHFARPVIEAAAMGKPAVASDLGGPRELIVPGETGLLVPPGDALVLADALASLLSDRARAQAMGEAAFRRALERFNALDNAAATIAVYEEILETRREG